MQLQEQDIVDSFRLDNEGRLILSSALVGERLMLVRKTGQVIDGSLGDVWLDGSLQLDHDERNDVIVLSDVLCAFVGFSSAGDPQCGMTIAICGDVDISVGTVTRFHRNDRSGVCISVEVDGKEVEMHVPSMNSVFALIAGSLRSARDYLGCFIAEPTAMAR